VRDWKGKRYWLVGASEGLGRALAYQLSRCGAEVIVSARSEERLRDLADDLPGRANAIPVDITNADSVSAAVDRAGPVDGLVTLAGTYWPMKTTEWNAERLQTMCDVNFTGTIRMLGAVVPGMIERGQGHVVVTGSLTALKGLPGALGYGATKAGLVSFAETMRADLQDTGVTVQVVNPGFIKTRLTDKNDFKMPMLMEPEKAATEIFEHMNGDDFRKDFPGRLAAMLKGGRALPDWLFYKLVG